MQPTADLRLWMTEATLLRMVCYLAEAKAWAIHRASMTKERSRTAINGQAGFPDIVLSRAAVTHFVELKSESGTLTAAQADWLARLSGTEPGDWLDGSYRRACLPTGIVAVWRPSDWDEVESILDGRSAPEDDESGRTGIGGNR